MPFIEAPTTFYLGKRYQPSQNRLTDEIVYYDSRDLTTHAVVVGMTGSGKTGLCISLLEEAILDNIPSIIIDPKGDITNLMLNFPNMQPQDFAPWVNEDDAKRAGLTTEQYAADTAQRWKDGLQSWGIVSERVKWLQLAAQYSIYTPGSDAGLPISILASLRAPKGGFHLDEEGNRERINGTVTALLSLIGKNAKPTEDPEHVLLANIFEYNWRMGKDLSLEDVIVQVKQPPFEKLGVFAVDQYIAEKRRYKLAMDLNSIIAAPSFQSWIRGEPLDIQTLLYQPNGRPRVSIFYIAHLSQPERMFIITLLLENMLAWMRMQSGTSSLRALLYIDEMFGYFPPYPQNPPTKDPILRLLKQARAFGVGLVLATQNPGDLDYKGLSNAGTWFIGRLQSENDRKKVMSGLESLATAEANLDLSDVERMIADVAPRVFLMHNVHNDGGPVLMHTRWAMSYLRGPLTRQQVRYLMAAQRQQLMQRYGQMPAQMNPYGQQQMPPNPYGQQQIPPNPYGQQQMPPNPYGQQQMPPNPYGQQQMPMPPNMPPPTLPGQQPNPYAQQAPMHNPYGTHGHSGSYLEQGFPMPPPMFGAQSIPNMPPPPSPFGQPPMPPNMPTQNPYGQQPPMPPTFGAQSAPMPTASSGSMGNQQSGFSPTQPALPSAITQYFLPERLSEGQALQAWEQRNNTSARGVGQMQLAYQPMLLGQATVRYQDKKTMLYTARTYAFKIPELPATGLIHWEDYAADPIDPRNVSGSPLRQGAMFASPPVSLTDPKRLKDVERELVDRLYNTAKLTLPFNPHLKMYGSPEEEFSVFQGRVYQTAREQRDAEVDKLTKRYEGLMDTLEDKLRRKIRELEAEKKELSDRKRQEIFTAGEAALSLLRGRTTYTLSRVSSATRMRRQTDEDLKESNDVIGEMEREMAELEQKFELELQQLNQKWANIANTFEEYLITPYKKDIQLEMFGVGWVPKWMAYINGQLVLIDAF